MRVDRLDLQAFVPVPALRGWQREMFGDKALALNHGWRALAIEKSRVIGVERG